VSRGPARPAALPIALGVLAGLALVAWVVVGFLDVPLGQRLVDLAVYRDAGRSVLNGRDVYGYLTPPPQRLSFTYPPFAALLSVPLAVLPFDLAGGLWTASELVLTTAITWWGFRRLWPRAGHWWPLALGVLAGLMTQLLPFRDEIKFGQVDELIVVLCVLDCAVRQPRWPRGVLIGVAAAIKLTPLVFVPYLFLTGRRRASAVAAATAVGLSLLTAAVIPGASHDYWTDDLFHTSRLQDNAGTSNQSMRGMLLRAGLPHSGYDVALVVAVIVVAVVGYRQAVQAQRVDEVAGVALTGLLAVLLSPVAWIHHLVWLPLVVGTVIADGRSPRRVAAGLGLVAFFVLRVPWIGFHMLHTAWPQPLARIVQDAFGLMAVVLIATLKPQGTTPHITRLNLDTRGCAGDDDDQRGPAQSSADVLARHDAQPRGPSAQPHSSPRVTRRRPHD
jgi:alpha-1,2-mannosyltransferase